MKIVYRAGNITEAEIVKGMLLANDMEAHVSGYYLQGGIGEMPPTDLAKVHVQDEDFERARELIEEYEGDQSAPDVRPREVELAGSSASQKVFITVAVIIMITVLGYWVSL